MAQKFAFSDEGPGYSGRIDNRSKENKKNRENKKSRKNKENRTKKKKTSFLIRFLKIFVILVLVFALVGVLGFGAANIYTYRSDGRLIYQYQQDAEKTAHNSRPEDFQLGSPSKIYDANNRMLLSLKSDETGSYSYYADIPKNAVNAFIAIEDRSFWENNGFSVKGSARALFSVLRHGSMTQGGSTITQQLVRTMYLTRDKKLTRKIKEIFLAEAFTKKYSKKRIMEFYINTCNYSNNIYGLKDAASAYFDKKLNQLDLSECAYLCAIPNRPTYYNPYTNSKAVIGRRNRILDAMAECGFITKSEATQAKNEKIVIAQKKRIQYSDYATTYALNCAIRYLMKRNGFEFEYQWDNDDAYKAYKKKYAEWYAKGRKELYTKGYTIRTSLDASKQKELQNILNKKLALYSNRKKSGLYELQGAMTVIDNQTHKVVGIIGGRRTTDATGYTLNRAFQSPRQPGSSIKPLVIYTPGIEMGSNAYTELKNVDVKEAYKAYKNKSDFDSLSGAKMNLRRAVEKSVNGCALYLYEQVTPPTGLGKLVKMNFSTIIPDDYTLSSGLGGLSYGATTTEMAAAYSSLANEGEYTQADCITSIKDSNGREIYSAPGSDQVYTEDAANQMTDILKGVVRRGTARSMNWSSSTEAAGKTGTTNSNKDAWFCGYTPYYTISVWCGNDDPQDTSLEGGTAPVQVWKAAQMFMIQGKPAKKFKAVHIEAPKREKPEYTGNTQTPSHNNESYGDYGSEDDVDYGDEYDGAVSF